MAAITDIAEAVKNELNSGDFSYEFTAERHYRPVFELPDMEQLHVTVIPKSVTVEAETRNADMCFYEIDVAVQKKLDSEGPDEIDPLMALVEEIADFFSRRWLAGLDDMIWTKTGNEPVYAAEHMEQLRQFTSVLTLTYRVLR